MLPVISWLKKHPRVLKITIRDKSLNKHEIAIRTKKKELESENTKNVQTVDIDHFWEAFDNLKNCKSYYDSAAYRFINDSCTVTNRAQKILIQSKMTYNKDTLIFKDFSGRYQCGVTGKYIFKVVGNEVKFNLVEDRCPPRTAITGMKWSKVRL